MDVRQAPRELFAREGVEIVHDGAAEMTWNQTDHPSSNPSMVSMVGAMR
jgi:hypothetical protein